MISNASLLIKSTPILILIWSSRSCWKVGLILVILCSIPSSVHTAWFVAPNADVPPHVYNFRILRMFPVRHLTQQRTAWSGDAAKRQRALDPIVSDCNVVTLGRDLGCCPLTHQALMVLSFCTPCHVSFLIFNVFTCFLWLFMRRFNERLTIAQNATSSPSIIIWNFANECFKIKMFSVYALTIFCKFIDRMITSN